MAKINSKAAQAEGAVQKTPPKHASTEAPSVEEILRAQQEFERRGGDSNDVAAPLVRLLGTVALESHRGQLEETGLGFYVLAAVRVCAMHGLVMPAWLVKAYLERFGRVLFRHVGTWDEAFDPPVPKGTQLAVLRRKAENRIPVFAAVTAAMEAGHRRSDEVFDTIAEQLDISRADVIDAWNEMRAILDGMAAELVGKSPRKSRVRKVKFDR